MSRHQVVISERLDDVAAAWLAQRCDVVWSAHDEPGRLANDLSSADGLIVRTYTRVDDSLLAAAPKLRVVGRAGVGLDNIDVPACRARGVEVVHTPDANTQAVVEYVLGLMLDAVRPRVDLPPDADDQAFHAMRQVHVGRQLDELTLGIVGFGRIGKRLGKVASALGMKLICCDVLPEEGLRAEVDYPFEFTNLESLLSSSDIVTIHVDGRAENRGLFDAAAFGAMKPDAMLINAARGMLVDHAAMAKWATEHPNALMVLDVHDPEPPRVGNNLRALPNVRMLPHLASRTDRALGNMSGVVEDVVRVLEGQTPNHPAP